MDRYDRLSLVLGTPTSSLGAAALDLIAQGIDPLFASEEDELVLLAREHRARVAALVLPGALPLARVGGVLARASAASGVASLASVIVAPPRQRQLLAGLRDLGVRWVVFAPYDASELRFAVMAALASGDVLEPRRGLRVPIHLPVSLRHARETRSGEIVNLSVGGAFVALDAPSPPPGDALTLEFPIGERLLRTQALVAHGREAGRPGVGVAFSGLGDVEGHLLEGFVRERIESFRL